MKKIYIKLIAVTAALALSVSVVAMSAYAWFVLSTSPVVSGLQVTIGGGNTILVAADMTKTVEGVTYHYPDEFSDKLNFSNHESYAYLRDLGGLSPVSTADGVNWFLPDYYTADDEQVLNGEAVSGELKSYADFILDTNMAHANLKNTETETVSEGSYVYLDFWVVAPDANYTLRISAGDETGGSFLVDLPQPVENGTTYTLTDPVRMASAAARVGFMADSAVCTDDSMLYYKDSEGFDSRFNQLRGSDIPSEESARFTIYEPNGDYHPSNTESDGTYIPTKPVGLQNGTITEVSVMDRVTVQKNSTWAVTENGTDKVISQIFETFITGRDLTDANENTLKDGFFNRYLQGQFGTYVNKGLFIKRSADLDNYNGTVTGEQLAAVDAAGATEDIYLIELEKNVPQRIRMFVWLEGQDVDCVDSASSASFAVNIELAGSSN